MAEAGWRKDAGWAAAFLMLVVVLPLLPANAAPPAVKVAKAAKPAKDAYTISRKSLADSVTFTVHQTIAPKDGAKFERVYKVSVKGNKARADFDDPAAGSVRYLANEKGAFSYMPDSKMAVKQGMKGGVEAALQLVFAQAHAQMANAKRIGSETVSDMPATVFKTADGASTIYWSEKPGFRLPVKVVQTNVGGTSTILVSDIRLNPVLADSLFAVPPGTQIMDGGDSPAAVPGIH